MPTTTQSQAQSRDELVSICKSNNIKGYSGKSKEQLVQMIQQYQSAPPPPPKAPEEPEPMNRIMSLFSGMGGMDVGFAEQVIVHQDSIATQDMAGSAYDAIPGFVNLRRLPFHTVFQNDILPAAKKIAELNQWDHNFNLKDVRDMLADKDCVFPQADVVTGGFPCQDFSHAGKRKGFQSGVQQVADGTNRGTLYQSFVEVVNRVKPTVFVAENVQGLLTMPGNPIQQIMADFAAVGYEVKHQLIKCEEFGIPQTRHRVIIMGIRLDCRPKLGSDDWNVISENRTKCGIRNYFKHLEEPAQSSDPAQQAYSKAARLEKGQGQSEICLDAPCPTMRAEHHGNIEFRRITGGKNGEDDLPERRLTVREAALIQTFPPNCVLTEGKRPSSMAYKPIGNAVPPLLGYLIARKVHAILKQCRS